MNAAWTIAWRELRSFFRVPLGWVAMAMYLLLAGALFAYGIVQPGSPASLKDVFGLSGFLLLPIVPAITMKLLSEEVRQGTIEPLMTSPASDWAIVLGKFIGAGMFLLLVLAPTLAHAVTLWIVSDPRPDLGPIISGYASLVLLGSVYLAAGILISSLTSNQTLAYLGTFLLLLAFLLSGSDPSGVPGWIARTLAAIAPQPRLVDFAKGMIDTAGVVYFVSIAGWLLVLSYVSLESRRWR